MLFIMNAIFGMYGIVWSQTVADILTVTMSFLVYYRFRPRFEPERQDMERAVR